MNREMEHIDMLAGTIGFRVATTEGERRAGRYIEQELAHYGLHDVRQEPFPCSSEIVGGLFPYVLAIIGSALLAPFAPLAGLGGMLTAPASLITEMRRNRGPILRLTRRGTSHNVIGILPASGERKAQVVLMAHYDSVRVRGYMKPHSGKPGIARRLMQPLLALSYLTAIGSTVVGLVARRKNKAELIRSTRRIGATASAAMLTMASPLLIGQAIPGFDGEGANDNASGVAVMLSTAEQLAQTPLENTEIWFVATGAEETGLNGARALIQEHNKELKDAYFFAIDTVGAGRIHYSTQERFMRSTEVSHEMLEILVTASEKGQHSAIPFPIRGGATDAAAALDKRYKAASICCLIKDGKWPEINWPTDVRKYVEPEVLPKVTAFMKDILFEINSRSNTKDCSRQTGEERHE
ncbi:MAG TPA: M20/M25/M40 family metallo-hydrolase [Ktedonobacteraceae bacterium]|nr:M20/M25/M40 family metallo-hydrolase [Ktedonobacteraceae bacterium]